MRPNWDVSIGTMLVSIGVLKVWSHVIAASTLTVPGCFGGAFVLHLNAPIWHRVHCWGCYVAIAGFVVLGRAAYQRYSLRKLALAV